MGALGGQLDELLTSLAARCRVCLLSSLYCILFIAWWQINKIDQPQTQTHAANDFLRIFCLASGRH